MLDHTEHNIKGQHVDFSCYETFCMESYDAHLVHSRIHWDRSYSFQSYAHIDVWNASTLTWNRLAELLPHEVDSEYSAHEMLRTLAVNILWGEDPR